MEHIIQYEEFINEGLKDKAKNFIDNLKKQVDKYKEAKHDLNKEEDKSDGEKILVVMKTDLCINPNKIVPLYYYIPSKDKNLEDGVKASDMFDDYKKYFKISLAPSLVITFNNPKYDSDATIEGESKKTGDKVKDFKPEMAWAKLSYQYEVDCTFDKKSFKEYCDDNKYEPKYCESLDDFAKVVQKIEKLYKEKQKEEDEFLDTPIDKIDDFKFMFNPDKLNEI